MTTDAPGADNTCHVLTLAAEQLRALGGEPEVAARLDLLAEEFRRRNPTPRKGRLATRDAMIIDLALRHFRDLDQGAAASAVASELRKLHVIQEAGRHPRPREQNAQLAAILDRSHGRPIGAWAVVKILRRARWEILKQAQKENPTPEFSSK